MTTDDGTGEAGFLGRWSRRKRAAAAAVAAPAMAVEQVGAAQAAAEPALHLPAPDLPEIETLDASSDYSVFLRKGVAAAVQAQALNKAWTSDAVIAQFRGMADYDWDFNATGYGRMWASDNVAKLLADVVGTPVPAVAGSVGDTDAPEPSTVEPSTIKQSTVEPPTVRLSEAVTASMAPEPVDESPTQPAGPPPCEPAAAAPRRHGSALPA